jgi:hypothetical protein
MAAKLTHLQQALDAAAATPQRATRPRKPRALPAAAPIELTAEQAGVPPTESQEPRPETRAAARRQSTRIGKASISVWLPTNFKKSLRMVQLRKDEQAFFEDLLAEALNDFFIKYNVPTVLNE